MLRRTFIWRVAQTTSVASVNLPSSVNAILTNATAGFPTGSYKAVVCLFLSGGFDGLSMLLPRTHNEAAIYRKSRGPLAVGSNDIVGITPDNYSDVPLGINRAFALPANDSELKDFQPMSLFRSGRLAFVTSVGGSVDNIPSEQGSHFAANALSHREYVRQWMLGGDSKATTDWADRTAIQLNFECKFAAQAHVSFHCGEGVRTEDPCISSVGLRGRLNAVRSIIQTRARTQRARDVFIVENAGWDHHVCTRQELDGRIGKLSLELSRFLFDLEVLGVADRVVVFSSSEFGRSLHCNGRGLDHGLANHHFVVGGPVRGRNVFGRSWQSSDVAKGAYPSVVVRGNRPGEITTTGAMMPSVSVEEYFCAFSRWLADDKSAGSSSLDLIK